MWTRGSSHHVTMDHAILVLHESYISSDSFFFFCDGTSLYIINIGSFTLTSLPTILLFTNVLYMPAMSKNLIFVSSLHADKPINVLFFYYFFQVQDHHSGVTLVRGQDSVYY